MPVRTVSPLPQGDQRREEAHGGAGVAQIDGLSPPAANGRRAPWTRMVGALPGDAGPQLSQGLGGEFGVFGLQGVAQDHVSPAARLAATRARWV